MSDNRNPDYPPSDLWDSCQHDWKDEPDSMTEGSVECTKCGAPGQRETDGSVYWPAT